MRSKRKSNQIIANKDLIQISAILGTIYIIINNLDVLLAVFGLVGLGGTGFLVWRRHQKRKQLQVVYDKLTVAISVHENALISYFNQSRTPDQFGNIDDSKWRRHIEKFLETKVADDVDDFRVWRDSELGCQAAAMVSRKTEELVKRQIQTMPLGKIDAADLTPQEYEKFCAEFFSESGWNVKMTPATRDGGADFVADKNGVRLIVQCKRYAQPVGNKAVQEANSALKLYHGNCACVVAPMGFTKQAQTEALCHGIHLLHHLELSNFAEKLIGASLRKFAM
jgi:restriction system protein